MHRISASQWQLIPQYERLPTGPRRETTEIHIAGTERLDYRGARYKSGTA